MYLRKQRRKNGRIYLSMVQAYRDVDGKAKARHVQSLGYLDELQKVYEDPVAHFQAEIDAENAAARRALKPVTVSLSTHDQIGQGGSRTVDIGAAVVSAYFYRRLGIGTFFRGRVDTHKLGFDPCKVLELLVWNQLVNNDFRRPLREVMQAFPRRCDFTIDDVGTCQEYLAGIAPALVGAINATLSASDRPPDRSILLYGIVRYWLNIARTSCEDGTTSEHEETSVLLGLLQDAQGFPLGYELFLETPGESQALPPGLGKTLPAGALDAADDHLVIVGSGAFGTTNSVATCVLEGNEFIFLWPMQRSTKTVRSWVLDPEGYQPGPPDWGPFMMKEREPHRAAFVHDIGRERRRVSTRMKNIALWLDSPSPYELSLPRASWRSDDSLNGHWCLNTSETDWPATRIVEAYRQLSRIKEAFPFHRNPLSAESERWTERHIRGYSLAAYLAFLVSRTMQQDVEEATGARPSTAEVSGALAGMVGHHVDANLWLFDYRTDLTDALCDAAGLDLSRRIMTREDIRRAMATTPNSIAWY